jgi:general secretion pathway protein D
MNSRNRWQSVLALVITTCLLAVPVSAFGKKGKDHYNRGLDLEKAQQWEKAAQEFTLAVASDPSNIDYQLHYRRAVFNASQTFMQQGRALAEQRDYVGAYNAFRQAFGYDPVNQLAVSEMERMLRLEQVRQGMTSSPSSGGEGNGASSAGQNPGTPAQPGQTRAQEPVMPATQEPVRMIKFTGDLRAFIRQLAADLNLNVIFDRQSFAQPRNIDVDLKDVTTAKALDYIFLQENMFFQKLDRRTILVADQARRPQYQQLVVRTFFIANSDPDKVKALIGQALPASVGRPQPIVVSDKDTNSLTVRDTAENVKLIGELLQSIDKDRAEVVMDVSIYEVNRSSLIQIGNQVGAGNFNMGGTPGLSILSSNATTTPGAPGVDVRSIVAAVPTAGALAFVIPPSVISMFQSKNNGKLLASTQIHAFNNEESTARIGQRVPVQTAQAYPFGVQTGTTTNPQTGFPSGGFPVINYEPTGLTLNFTPQVFPNLDVQVKMKIEAKDVSGANTLTPTFTERTITGTARVQNNRTMMLASVSQDIQSNGRSGIAVLSGLPFLGRLFSAPTKENRQVDIVIAVTPRVLRAPAVTPRDEEMRPSGTLQSPTTGSIATMLEETAREEQMIAARRIPKNVVVQIPDPAVTYEPAKAAAAEMANTNGTKTESNHVTLPQQAASFAPATQPATQPVTQPATQPASPPAVQTAAQTAANTNSQPESAMPQPKSAAVSPPPASSSATQDVTSALKNLVSSGNVSAANLTTKQETPITPVAEQLSPKTEKASAFKTVEALANIIEFKLTPSESEMKAGEKKQLSLQVNSGAPLGLAVITLRFDPKVIKISSVTPGTMFANAKTAPALTQSIDEHGMILLSLTPAAGSSISGEGSLLNLEIIGLSAGDAELAFDLSNVHVVASDGRTLLLQIEPLKLTVK